MMIPWSLVSAARGRLWLIDEPVLVLTWAVAIVGGTALLSWVLVLWRAGRLL